MSIAALVSRKSQRLVGGDAAQDMHEAPGKILSERPRNRAIPGALVAIFYRRHEIAQDHLGGVFSPALGIADKSRPLVTHYVNALHYVFSVSVVLVSHAVPLHALE